MPMYKRAAIWCDTFGYNFSVLRTKLAHPESHPTSSNLEHELLELPPTHGPIKMMGTTTSYRPCFIYRL
jgi:hypothetical protein